MLFRSLIFVFDRYMLAESARVPDREHLARDLEQAGFQRATVQRALDWLTDLAFGQERVNAGAADTRDGGVRVFTDIERLWAFRLKK